ncbi:hypothetical protein K4F52_005193 [Lecanicillium sp. MT-2017a]|nr:hypothetical protein K4F52_005193 [Lecanicillium sp. MT-2017a]
MATSSSERRPLLGETDAQPNPPKNSISRPYLTVVAPCFIFYVSLGVMINLYNTAADQIAEGIICRNIHGHIADPMNDPRCKAEAVQSELSLLNGFENTFELIPSVLCVLPYGRAADKYGRRKLFILNNVGGNLHFFATFTIFAFPHIFNIRLIWAACMLDFVGGGQSVFETLSYTMVSDATPVSMRSTTFFWLSAAIMVGRIVSGPLTLFAMDRGEWFTLRLSIAIYILIGLASFLVKETHERRGKESESEMADDEAASRSKDKFAVFVKGPVVEAWTSTRTLFASDKKVAALLSAILFTAVGKFVTKLLLRQYIAKRFHFTWAKASSLV